MRHEKKEKKGQQYLPKTKLLAPNNNFMAMYYVYIALKHFYHFDCCIKTVTRSIPFHFGLISVLIFVLFVLPIEETILFEEN